MILIISHNDVDEPTNIVIDWLNYYNANFKRINGIDFSFKNNILFNINDLSITGNNNDMINANEINVVWYRRWQAKSNKGTNFEEYKKAKFSNEEVNIIEDYQRYMTNELNSFVNGFFSLFSRIECIPKIKHARGGLNKLNVLMYAKKQGLLIPDTIITTSKKELLSFHKKHKSIITKPISEVVDLTYKETKVIMFTKEIKLSEIKLFSEYFFPSLFQEKINKVFEIRTFVHFNKVFSMAIFSQRDSQTSIDFRNYNHDKPNRNVPFKLPDNIEKKVLNLFKDLDLTTGSVDLIYDLNDNFYFLEINPVGQLSMVSIGGNYNLEKIIAEDLIKINDEKSKINKN